MIDSYDRDSVAPVLADLVATWDYALTRYESELLLDPILPRLAGTLETAGADNRRAYMIVDWSIRVSLPAWLDLMPRSAQRAARSDFPRYA